jgi:hypothetical protein
MGLLAQTFSAESSSAWLVVGGKITLLFFVLLQFSLYQLIPLYGLGVIVFQV